MILAHTIEHNGKVRVVAISFPELTPAYKLYPWMEEMGRAYPGLSEVTMVGLRLTMFDPAYVKCEPA